MLLMWWVEHTGRAGMAILAALNHGLNAMKNFCTNTLVVLVVAVATVRSYATLALHTRVLPRHLA